MTTVGSQRNPILIDSKDCSARQSDLRAVDSPLGSKDDPIIVDVDEKASVGDDITKSEIGDEIYSGNNRSDKGTPVGTEDSAVVAPRVLVCPDRTGTTSSRIRESDGEGIGKSSYIGTS